MNDINAIIDNLASKLVDLAGYSKVEILPYLELLSVKLVRYELITSIIWIIFCSVAMLVLYKAFKKAKKEFDADEYGEAEGIYIVIMIISPALMLAAFLCATGSINQVIKCLVFPEKIVIDYIMNLK